MATEKLCPRCNKLNSHHLMMVECDKCINEICSKHENEEIKYIKNNGILVPKCDPDGY